MEGQVKELLRRYPHLDHLICETLLKLQDKLSEYDFEMPPKTQDQILVGAVHVENVAEDVKDGPRK